MENNTSNAAPARNEGGEGSANGDSAKINNWRGGRSQDRGRGRSRGRGGGGRGRGQGRGDRKGGFGANDRGSRQKRGELGRGEYNRNELDKRKRNAESQAKRHQKEENGESNALFSKEEIESEERKPKRKVAVMIGYAGSGYKGMQINALEKTIEGDLFNAFVKAGAISKANADDPKKSSLVRCARTDKGVHAAGNVISLKLIVEDPKIVETINENLPSQIRVWGLERTNGSFSCYQTCDSRWYEYLIPTFAFIPPHPQSYLGKKLDESAKEENAFEAYQKLQTDGALFWENAEENYVKPILEKLDPQLRLDVMAAIHSVEDTTVVEQSENDAKSQDANDKSVDNEEAMTRQEGTTDLPYSEDFKASPESHKRKLSEEPITTAEESAPAKRQRVDESITSDQIAEIKTESLVKVEAEKRTEDKVGESKLEDQTSVSKSVLTPLEVAIKDVKAAYISAKKAYRISDERRQRVQEGLNIYLGTRNFHNYTVQKRFSDPSAKRIIRSFNVGKDPVIINNTEWLSLKVHGQSFMMHQIRKMVAMVALVVRCASPLSIINESYTNATISIPKAPGLGLLLERPVFQTYNDRCEKEYSRKKLDFDKYQKEMDEFKQREIYDRIFREEERDHQFHSFFHHLDHYRTEHFLWVTAKGVAAAKQSHSRKEDVSDDEVDFNGEEG